MSKTEELVSGIAEDAARKSGYRLVDVKSMRGPRSTRVIVYLHKPGGITLEDCESFSRELGARLDEDPAVRAALPDSYLLEVSSPGVNRELKTDREYRAFEGEEVCMTVYEGALGPRNEDEKTTSSQIVQLDGTLRGLQGSSVLLERDGIIREIPKEAIRKAHLCASRRDPEGRK
ncbi:MAG TPA: ribosome maturation factor RimP [Clostridia bacterium]|nr:ribosome maturation factor RimP [Clostridia bacterium]